MTNSISFRRARSWRPWVGLAITLLLALLSYRMVGTTVAQGNSDEELAAQLEPIILEQTTSPGRVNTVVEIPVSQDTYVASNQPNRNYGGAGELRLGYNRDGSNDGALRTFIQFDVARHVPAQAIINSASLRVYMFASSPGGDSSMGMLARHLNTSWRESQVTWRSHQPDWGGIISRSDVGSALGWQSGDVTSLVSEWHNRTHTNNGILFIGDERVQERQRWFYSLNANNGLHPRLVVDYTVSTDTTPPTASVIPLPERSPSTFTVSWIGSDNPGGSGIAYYDVQYNVNGGLWVNFKRHTFDSSGRFAGAENNVTYQFRARAVDFAGNVQPFGVTQTQTRVDAIAPTASVDPLPEFTFVQSFTVSWSGTDNPGGSGVAAFDVEFRVNNGAWQTWLAGTTATTAQFTGAQDDGVYGFRVRATDVVGNVQPYSGTAQAETTVETSGPISFVEPFNPPLTRADSFPVQWSALTLPNLSIRHFDVRYQFNNGPWIEWLSGTTLTGATFTDLNPADGIYGFEARAEDTAGRVEPFEGVADATIIVDRLEPFVTPRLSFPFVTCCSGR